jgi:hypothetical protein
MKNELQKIGTLANVFCKGRVHPGLMLVEEILVAFIDFYFEDHCKELSRSQIIRARRDWEEFKEAALRDFSEAFEWQNRESDYRYFKAHCYLLKLLSRDPYSSVVWRKFRLNCSRDEILNSYINQLVV